MPPPTRRALFIALAMSVMAVVLLAKSPSLLTKSSYYRDLVGRPSLKGRLMAEEGHYATTLKGRAGLIRKWGPTDAQVNPWPTNGDLYTLWDFFVASFQCPHRVERIGTMGDGGKWVCGLDRVAKQEKCVVYSFGINGESSFEAELLERAPACELWGYDFSVKSWGPQIENEPALKSRAHFQAWALGDHDAHGDNDHPKLWTLDSLMKLNGHDFIDFLKIDIDGGEFEVLLNFIEATSALSSGGVLPIGQLQIEIHAFGGHDRFEYFHQWWTTLEAAGLRPFWTEPNLVYVTLVRPSKPDLAEYSFMNIRGNHALVSDAYD